MMDVAQDVVGAGLASPLAIVGLALLGIGGIAYLALSGQRWIGGAAALVGLGLLGWFGWQAWPAASERRAQIAEAANAALMRAPEIARAVEEKAAEVETGRVAAIVRSPPAGLEVVSADPATGRIEVRAKEEVRCKPGGEHKQAMVRIQAPEGFRVKGARLAWLGGERPRADGNIHGGIGPIIYRDGDETDAGVAEAEMYCQSANVRIAGLRPDAWTRWEMIGTIEATVREEERARLLRDVVAAVDPALRARVRAEAEANAPTLAERMASRGTP